MRILVIGGTGRVGAPLVRELIERGAPPVVLMRASARAALIPATAKVAVADILEEPAGVRAIMSRVDAVYMINRAVASEAAEGAVAVMLAREAGVKRFVYQSAHLLDELAHLPHLAPKVAVRAALERSGLAFTLICPNHFFQNDEVVKRTLVEEGVYATPLGEVGCHGVDTRDIAEAAAVALTTDGHEGKAYSVVGPERLTASHAAALWTEALGRPIRAADGVSTWRDATKPFLPPWMHYDLTRMYEGFATRGMLASDADVAACAALLGRPPRGYRDYTMEKAAEWRS
jgi:uncharacterized protein YbjT (DUF2867 family)